MPPTASRALLTLTVFAAVLGTGLAHGLLTDRWAVDDPAASLDRVPMTVEDWDGSTSEADRELLRPGEPGQMLVRRYVHRPSGALVTAFLAVGRAGPMVSGHMPE